jgi:peptidoglycan LD-endopeptidase CwlK
MAVTLQSLLDRAESKLTGVHPTVREKAIELVKRAHAKGINVLITQGLRTIAEQNELYAQGRTKPGKIVTNAKGGYSYHNFGLAFDIVIQNAEGSLCWNTGDKRWQTVGALGKSLGLEWGGEWRKFPDYPHFQLTFGLTLADLRAGKRPPTPRQGGEAQVSELQKAIEWAKKHGISDCQRLDEPVKRSEVLRMLYRLHRALGGEK